MATPSERLAAALEQLEKLQRDGRHIFRSSELGRTHRERLVRSGFLREIIKGWLISISPGTAEGDTTSWYASLWEFCGGYCDARFGRNWHMSPEQSLLLHAENAVIPGQIVIYSPKGTNNTVNLLFGTSLYDLKQKAMPPAADLTVRDSLRLYSPAAALVRVPEGFFQRFPVEAQVALAAVKDASEVLGRLLEGGHSAIAARLAGAFRRVGRVALADEIVETMKSAGYDVRELDPFMPEQKPTFLEPGIAPVAGRIKALWDSLRAPVLEIFPKPPGLPKDSKAYLDFVDEIYKSDAYHSLSIEGYAVTPDLIERVQSGNWSPDSDEADRNRRNALAARGYWQAFQLVKEALAKLIEGKPPGALVRAAHRDWYREMFQPSVAAGLLSPAALAGYRRHPVYIRGSRHVPPRSETVPDAMTALFDLLELEAEASVRAVLGHWIFGYIHPYPDGNGRMARFLMNAMLGSGGYAWTIIRVEDRDRYMRALEAASIDADIRPFAEFIAERVRWSMAKAA